MIWTHRTIAAPASTAWALLTDVDRWPEWGPSVAQATLDEPGEFRDGATGKLRTVAGPTVRFRLKNVVRGQSWGWTVAGIPSTAHEVKGDEKTCTVGFGVPTLIAPYIVICNLALDRIERALTE